MKQWFYSEDSQQMGPVAESELSALLEQGRISPDALVWSEGMAEWTPLGQVAEFNLSPYAPPASDTDSAVNWDPHLPTGPQVRPWIRYWARSFDIAILSIVISTALEFIYPKALEMEDALFGIVMAAVSIPVEAAIFAAFGTTPFKALLNVRVRNRDGTRLGFSRALSRTFQIWIRGEGLGVPLISWIANYTAYKRLGETGVTSWDTDGGFTVSHRSIEVWKIALVILIIAGLVALFIHSELEP